MNNKKALAVIKEQEDSITTINISIIIGGNDDDLGQLEYVQTTKPTSSFCDFIWFIFFMYVLTVIF